MIKEIPLGIALAGCKIVSERSLNNYV